MIIRIVMERPLIDLGVVMTSQRYGSASTQFIRRFWLDSTSFFLLFIVSIITSQLWSRFETLFRFFFLLLLLLLLVFNYYHYGSQLPLFRSVIFEFVRVVVLHWRGRFADWSDTVIIIGIMISCCYYLASCHCYDQIRDLWGFVLPLNRHSIPNLQSTK